MRPAAALRALAVSLAALLAPAAGCRDAPERAGQPVDTAALEDRRIFEGEIGRDTGDAPSDTTAAGDTVAARAEPTLVLAADSAAGYLLFHRSAGCIACHGAGAQGLENLGPDLRDDVWLHIDGTPRSIERVIRTGIARPREAAIAMPALGTRLESEEIRRLAAYVYSLSHPAAVVTDTAAARDSLRARAADSIGLPPVPPPDTTPPPDPHAQARRHQR